MRTVALGVLGLFGAVTPPTHAQIVARLDAGAVWTSDLAQDVIVNPITVAPAVAPAVGLWVGTPLSDVYRVGVRVQWARSDVIRHEAGAEFTVLPLTVWTGTLSLERRLHDWIAVEAGVGAIKYAPGSSDRSGTLFQDDAPLLATVGLGARARRPVSARWALGAYLTYDAHQFATQALRAGGVTGTRTVHRVSGGVSVYWSVG